MTTITRRSASRHLGADVSTATNLDEALHLAGLDWGITVREADNLTLMTEDGMISTNMPGKRLIMRDDTYVTLGVAGGRYTAVSNREFFGLADAIAAAGGRFASAGETRDGQETFLELDIPEANVRVGGTDLVNASALLRAVHDGSGKAVANVKMTRLVCTNGMRGSIPGTTDSFAVAHTLTAGNRIAQADHIMRSIVQYAKAFGAVAQEMLDTPFTRAQFGSYIDTLFPEPEAETGRAHTIWENRRAALIDLFQFAETNALGRDTRWGAYNALTEYLDWSAPVRSKSLDADTQRALRQMNGSAQSVKDAGFSLLVNA